jgi:hypothetical protein
MEIPIALGAGFILMGFLAMGISVVTLIKARREVASQITTSGVVVAIRSVAGQRGYIYCPTVQFRTDHGQLVTIESSVGGQPPLHSVGQQVTVFYSRADPQKAEVEAPTVLWLVPGCIFGVGLVFSAVGMILILVFGLIASNAPR